MRERFDIARAKPGSILLTPAKQAAKNFAKLLIAKHADMHEACGVLEETIGHDMAIVKAGGSPEAVKTAEDRLELHRQAIAFICAHHRRAGTMPKTLDDDEIEEARSRPVACNDR